MIMYAFIIFLIFHAPTHRLVETHRIENGTLIIEYEPVKIFNNIEYERNGD